MLNRVGWIAAALVLPASAFGVAAAGCGPDVAFVDPSNDGGGGGGANGSHNGHATVGPGGFFDGGGDALPDYVDPGCPDSGPAPTAFECDPYNQFNGDCGPGDGCYIFVKYPEEPCGQEI